MSRDEHLVEGALGGIKDGHVAFEGQQLTQWALTLSKTYTRVVLEM